MSAVDYPVTFGYRATDGVYYGPNGSVGKYHRGNDHACPIGTPIVIAGVTIGETGNTGVTGGPHLHVQAGTDQACQKDIDPTPYEFQPGTVVAVGYGSQWGNYITLQVGERFVTYCHLSKQFVQVGQEIKKKEDQQMIDKLTLARLYSVFLGREPDQAGIDNYVGKYTASYVINEMLDSDERHKYIDRLNADAAAKDAELAKLRSQVAQGDGSDAAKKLQAIKDALA